MRYVLDSSVAFKTLVAEQDSDKAIRLLDDFRNGICELLAPDILPIEVAHALTRAERQARITSSEGYTLWSLMMADCPQLFPSLSLMTQAYTISSQERLGIYDCLYIALAEQEGCTLVTDDARLEAVFPKRVILLGTL
jgi:predicted nucleic acid-binding protein